MNKTNIDWADYTWNPVIGCKHGCAYCYAERINARFKFIDKWEEPEFFQLRLMDRIPKIPKERNNIAQQISPDKPIIFVGSMCDLFGEWIDEVWILRVLNYCHNHPEANFMFLTKNPKRYLKFKEQIDLLNNIRIGATFTSEKEIYNFKLESLKLFKNKNFISIEPILGDFKNVDFDNCIDFIIVGAMTGKNTVKPQREWIESIQHKKVYLKKNIKHAN